MPLDDLYKKIVVLQEFNLEKEVMDIINEEGEFLEDLIKYQLASGLDSEGNPKSLKRKGKLFLTYSDFTIRIKEEFGIGIGGVTDRITHQMTGEFYASLNLRVRGTDFDFISDVSYFDDIILSSGQGKKLLELSKENLNMFTRNVLIPEIQRRFKIKFDGI